MIVFGPIMFLFLFGIFCIIMDIIYTKEDQPVHTIQKPIPVQNNWVSEYIEEEEPIENKKIKYEWDEDNDFLS